MQNMYKICMCLKINKEMLKEILHVLFFTFATIRQKGCLLTYKNIL